MLIRQLLLVGVGGMIGSMLRYVTGYLIRLENFPYATFTVNILGSLLIGAIMGFAAKQDGFTNWRLFLATGICGGFTTFSAFAWENLQLLGQERYGTFVLYTSATLALGLAAVALGYWLTK
jgi:CrcB protein